MMIDSGQLPSKIMGQYSHPIHFHFLLAQLKQLFSISTEHLWPFTQNDPPFDQNDQNFPPFSSYYIAILIMIIVMLGHSKKEAIILPSDWCICHPPLKFLVNHSGKCGFHPMIWITKAEISNLHVSSQLRSLGFAQASYLEKLLFRPNIRKLLSWVDIAQIRKLENSDL